MKALKIGAIVVVVVLVLLYNSLFVVKEGQKALVLYLGKIKLNAEQQPIVYGPGLHIKTPFINTARIFDIRLQTLVEESSRVLTEEQKYLLVDYYAKWNIADLAQYYKSTSGLAETADRLLAQKINDGMRAEFGRQTISDVVSDQRINVMKLLKQKADEASQGLGISVVDVRINRIDLPSDVSASVFARMRAQREQVAAKHRADGKSAAEAIRAQADAQVTVTMATAKERSASVRAEGDASAAKIYVDAYSHDLPFYNFYQSLAAYQQVFSSGRDTIVLTPDNQFMKYFQSDAEHSAK